MKKAIRLISLLLCLLMVGSLFVGCGDDKVESNTDVQSTVVSVPEDVVIGTTQDDPYELKQDKDGNDLVILVPEEDGSITMEVAEKTTLETFLTCAVAKEGHTIRVLDDKGAEITDMKAIIATGMKFEVVKDGEDTAAVSLAIRVITKAEIADKIEKQEDVDDKKENIKNPSNNPSSKGDDKASTASKDTTPKTEVKMVTIYGSSYLSSTATAKVWQSSLKTIEEKKHYKTTIGELDALTAVDVITKDVMAGKSGADVYDISLNHARQLAKSKAIANWLDSKTLDFSKVQNGGTKAITFGKKCYGVALNGTSGVVAGIMFNKDLISKYAPEYDLHKLYKQNKWDFDAFREVAKLCTRDTDGDGKTDIYGVTSNTNIIGIMLTSNAGGTALMKNGRVEATMCNDAGIAALEFCKTLFKTDRSWKYYGDVKESVAMFSSGRSAMLATNLYFYSLVAPNANFKFDFVHAPMGPDYGKYVDGVYDASVFVVPKTNEKQLDKLGTWINHLTTISGKLLNIEAKNMAMNGFSQDAIEIFKWCKNNMQADFSTGAFTSAVASQVDSSVTSASKSPAKVMNAIKQQAQTELDDFYANMY